jgi:hypothetical protein
MTRPLRVLLAEDNDTNQLVFCKLIQGWNVELAIAWNGAEALALAKAHVFDVVFMDMRMPVMDGLEATRALRALGGQWNAVPIIALTANAFADDVKACFDAGMNDFIAKPLRKPVLIETLAKAVAGHLPGSAGDASAAAAEGKRDEARASLAASFDPPPMAEAAPVLDDATFDELVEAIGEDGACTALAVFAAETTVRLDLLRSLSCGSDHARIKEEAHALKGASGTLGLRQLSDLARTLEFAAPSIAGDDYVRLLDRLDAYFRAARKETEQAIAGLSCAAPRDASGAAA